MNTKFFLSIAYILIFSGASTLWTMEAAFGPRRLIILFDPHGQEIATSTDFAIMSGLIAALEQQTAPIIVSESLWNNFVIRRHRYDKLKDKHYTAAVIHMELLHKYGPTLTGPNYLSNNKTIEKLHDLYAAHYGYYQQALQVIRKHPATPFSFTSTTQSANRDQALKQINVKEQELQPDNPLRKDIDFDFVCYKTLFDPKEWTVHHIPNLAYILVPQAYEKKLIQPKDLPQISNLTKRELVLGLKVDHMAKVSDPLKVPDQVVSAKQAEATDKADLGKIFVTRQDLGLLAPRIKQKAPESFENYLGAWNVYATGHGSPDKGASIQEQITAKEQALAQYRQELVQLDKDIAKYTKDMQIITTQLSRGIYAAAFVAKEATQKILDILHENKNASQQYVIGLMQEIINLSSGIQSGRDGGVIAGLYIDEFKEVLGFFNSSVRTGLFFYDTCFGSGKNLEAGFQYKNIPQTYNYAIASGASVDAPTTVGGAKIAVPPYTGQAGTLFVQTQLRNGQEDFKIYVEQRFDTYFKQLEEFQVGTSQETLADILNTIHTFKISKSLIRLHNVPLVRFPSTEWFRVVDMPKVVASITEQSVITHQAENKPFKLTTQEALLMSTPHVPVPVNIENNKMPAVLSMIGGNADHYFAEIDAPKVPLSVVIQQFMPIPGQYFTKGFLIKKLTCLVDTHPLYKGLIAIAKGDKVTLQDVIIIQNDTEYFTEDPHNKVNVVLFTYTGISRSQALIHQAIWPTSQKLSSSEIPNLEYLPEGKNTTKLLAKVAQAFAQKSQPPIARAEQLAGRKQVISSLQEKTAEIKKKTAPLLKAAPLIKKYKEKREEGPQALSSWINSLSLQDRELIKIIQGQELPTTPATLTKKEFAAFKKGQQLPTAGGGVQPTISLKDALQQLERSLKNLQQRLR